MNISVVMDWYSMEERVYPPDEPVDVAIEAEQLTLIILMNSNFMGLCMLGANVSGSFAELLSAAAREIGRKCRLTILLLCRLVRSIGETGSDTTDYKKLCSFLADHPNDSHWRGSRLSNAW